MTRDPMPNQNPTPLPSYSGLSPLAQTEVSEIYCELLDHDSLARIELITYCYERLRGKLQRPLRVIQIIEDETPRPPREHQVNLEAE